jgi:hypothetical protein
MENSIFVVDPGPGHEPQPALSSDLAKPEPSQSQQATPQPKPDNRKPAPPVTSNGDSL